MAEDQIRELVMTSDMIINGYAFSHLGDNVRILNMNTGTAAVLFPDGSINEASMDDIELDIVQDYYRRNAQFMAVENA